MRDYIELGSTPYDEDCAQVGEANYRQLARFECQQFIAQLRRLFGPEPDGAELRVKAFSHDFGTYYEVVCYFDDTLPESVDYAFQCEGDNAPANWDDEARQALKTFRFTLWTLTGEGA